MPRCTRSGPQNPVIAFLPDVHDTIDFCDARPSPNARTDVSSVLDMHSEMLRRWTDKHAMAVLSNSAQKQ